jgi:cytoskeletal protein CcmA (bactofilin family)
MTTIMENKKFRNELVNTIVGEEASIKGDIETQRSIRVEGTIEGTIHSKGEVYIGEKSKVNANVYGQRIIIAGEVNGNVEAVGGLHICKTGKVYGDITGDQLTIEEGAIYRGKVNMDIISSKNAYEGNIKLAINK